MKKIFTLIIAVMLCLSFAPIDTVSAKGNVEKKILESLVKSINEKGHLQFEKLFWKNDETITLKDALNDKNSFFNAHDSVELINYINIPVQDINNNKGSDLINHYTDYRNYDQNNVKIVYFAYSAVVAKEKENSFIINGDNFNFLVLVKKDGVWKAEYLRGTPSVEDMLELGFDLGTKTESDSKLKSNIPVLRSLKYYSYITLPSTIKVKTIHTIGYNSSTRKTGNGSGYTTNYQAFGVSKGSIITVNFKNYVKDVLPNEWESAHVMISGGSNKINSIKAGSLMVKSYAYYYLKNPKGSNYHVDDYNSQVFVYNSKDKVSANSSGTLVNWGAECSSAVDSVWRYNILKDYGLSPFHAGYDSYLQGKTVDLASNSFHSIIDTVYSSYNPLQNGSFKYSFGHNYSDYSVWYNIY